MSNGHGNIEMEELIHVINRLQDAYAVAGLSSDLNLPQIIVIGSQSAGKSSVLENFVGRDFLPRGHGVVTRRPIILQLHTCREEYAEFLHSPGKKFCEAEDIKAEIERATQVEVGNNSGFSDKPITLKTYSPRVLNVTLVDLPGMTKVPIGEQPPDIAEQIKAMIRRFIESPNTIILAVSPANADLATSDAMQMAKEVDPEGNRTIGVITKLDMMDHGTDAREVLKGSVIPLKLGYVGVVNRSQQDIVDHKDIRAAVDSEKHFFDSHPSYKGLKNTGTGHLQRKLNKELKQHIFQSLPKLKADLTRQVYETQEEQGKYETAVSPEKAKRKMMKCIHDFEKEVKVDVSGHHGHVSSTEIASGPRINALFYEEFAVALALDTPALAELKQMIAITIKNIRGFNTELFSPDEAFRSVVKAIIERFRVPIKNCVDAVATILNQSVQKSAEDKISHYFRMREDVLSRVTAYIQKQQDGVKEYLMKYMDAESAFQNVRHEDMLTSANGRVDDASPEFTKSVPSLRNDLRSKTTSNCGYMRLSIEGNPVPVKRYWFVLQPGVLKWYERKPSQGNERPAGSLVLTPQVKMKTSPAEQKVVLYDESGQDLLCSLVTKELVFTLENSHNQEQWQTCLRYNGVELTREDLVDPPDADTGFATSEDEAETNRGRSLAKCYDPIVLKEPQTETLRFDHDLNPQVTEIRLMVESYLQIVNKTIRDMVPKYVVLVLVDSLLAFISEELVDEFLANKDPIRMLEDDGESEREYERCQQKMFAAKEALHIINDVFGRDGEQYYD